MELLTIATVAGLVFLLALVASRPVVAFALTVQEGKVRVTQGKVCQAFVDEVQAIVTDCAIASGVVKGVRRARRVGLTFSPHIPARSHQRFRNVWALHGTPVTPVTSGRRQRHYLLGWLTLYLLAGGALQAQDYTPGPAGVAARVSQ